MSKGIYVIVGMQHRDAADYVRALAPGADLVLEREPTNAYDPNAVKVLHSGKHIGYIKGRQAQELGPAIDAKGEKRIPAIFKVSGDQWPMAEVEES